ncbi:MAG TPA: hypothetical protein VK939_05215 [Longimicrobiales bacterium]|nr:hypothetical protein [Longimicrobiales bacterium]
MSHVDEGTLHAYLDSLERGPAAGALSAAERGTVDAHVAQCSACAAALAEARTLRERAGTVLASAAPTIDMPPFESMSARRPASRTPRRWVPLAWAASLVMAVGSGWIASELWRSGAVQPAAEQRAAGRTAEPGPARGSAPQLADAETGMEAADAADANADIAAPSPRAGVAPASGESPAGAGARERDTRQAAAPDRSVPETGVAAAAAAAESAVPGLAAARAARPDTPMVVVPSAANEQRNALLESRPPTPAAGESRAQLKSAAPTAPAPPAALSREAVVPAADDAAANARDTLAYAGDAAVEWEAIGMSAAAQRLGAPLELLAEASVLAVASAEPGVVRVRQRLPSGAEAELVQWRLPPAGVEATDAERAADAAGRDAVRVVREGIAADGRAWVLLAWTDRMVALKAPPGVLPLALLPRLERER